VRKMIAIGSMGSAPHVREIYSYRRRCLPFFSGTLQPEREYIATWTNYTSIDVDFLKEVPFGGVEICKQNFRGHICSQRLKKIFNHCTSMKFFNNF
jgi:hypothetical protein